MGTGTATAEADRITSAKMNLKLEVVDTANITAANVTYAKIQDVAALSFVGRSADTAGVSDAITGADGQVARVAGTALGFGTIVAAGIAADAVTTAKILNLNVTTAKINDLAVTTGKIEDLHVTTGKIAAAAVTLAKTTFLTKVFAWDVAELADGAGETSAALALAGAALGNSVSVGCSVSTAAMLVFAWVAAADEIRIRVQNETGAAVNLAAADWTVVVIK